MIEGVTVLEQILLTVNSWMMTGTALAALGCFLWGVVSVVFSPCHLASIPLIVAYVAGQDKALQTGRAASYAVIFTVGLFITIALVGIVCSILGRMLGEVGPYWTILVGGILIWVALDMLGIARCSISGSLLGRMKIKGLLGAFLLGLAYGVLSGSCTFGFISADSGDHYDSGKGPYRAPLHRPVRGRPLYPHSRCREFDRKGEEAP